MNLSSRNWQADFCEKRGNLKTLLLRTDQGFAPWNGRPGYLAIVDERRGRTYQDVESPAAVSVERSGGGIRSVKQFRGADFSVTESWRRRAGSLYWNVDVALDPGVKPRTIQIRQLIPYPDPAYGLGVWTAHPGFPTTIDRLGGWHLRYGELCYGTVLPSLTFYRPEQGIGLTIAKPLGFRTSRLTFDFMDYRCAGVELHTSMLALRPEQPAKSRFIIRPHEACWRPGLAWLYDRYPTYFDPPNPRVRDIEGGYVLGHPFMTDGELDSMLPAGLKWEELHCHFPRYGDYLPDEPQWTSIDSWEACVDMDQVGGAVVADRAQPDADGGSSVADRSITPDLLRDHVRQVQKRKVQSLYYWQSAGDASPDVAEAYPDSVALDRDGRPFPSCAGSVLMNADPTTLFGRSMLRQIDRLFKRLPGIDGIFLDQLCYDAVDHAHDDGITMVDNRPAYTLWHCYDAPVRRLTAAAHRRGKLVFANGAFNVEVQRDVDGLMAEGASWLSKSTQYLCIAKPLLFLAFYHDDPRRAESMFHCCLLSGASYSLFPHPPEPVRQVIDTYRPMVERLYGRRWLLEPDPLTLPDGVDGNIFIGECGETLVTLVSTRRSCLDQDGLSKDLDVRVRWRGAASIAAACSLGTHYRGKRDVAMHRHGDELRLVVPEHGAATLIILAPG